MDTKKILIYTNYDILIDENEITSIIKDIFSLKYSKLEFNDKGFSLVLYTGKIKTRFKIRYIKKKFNKYMCIKSSNYDYRFFYFQHNEDITFDEKDFSNNQIISGEVNGTNTKIILELLGYNNDYINEIDKERINKRIVSGKNLNENFVYVGKRKMLDYSLNSRESLLQKSTSSICIVMYTLAIHDNLVKYYSVKSRRKLQHLNKVKDAYNPYTFGKGYKIHGLTIPSAFDSVVYKKLKSLYEIRDLFKELSEESESRAVYGLNKKMYIMNLIIFLFTLFTFLKGVN